MKRKVFNISLYRLTITTAPQRMSISLDVGSKWRWYVVTLYGSNTHFFRRSGAFSLSDIGTNYVKLHEVAKNEDYFLPLHISNNEGTLIIIFKTKSKESYPYRIDNFTREVITYWQEEVMCACTSLLANCHRTIIWCINYHRI
jgi:hypothetical protein